MSNEIHQLVDGNGRPLALLLSAGQVGDSPMLPPLLEQVSIPRAGRGRPRTRPDVLIGDKGYCAAGPRRTLRTRGITPNIPERADQQANRARRGQRGGRSPSFDPLIYQRRNLVGRAFRRIDTWRGVAWRGVAWRGVAWRGVATRYDKHARNYRGGLLLRALLAWATSISAARVGALIS